MNRLHDIKLCSNYFLGFVGLILLTSNLYAQSEDYTKYVNPFIGTAENGHTFPGASVPFGFVQVSPETSIMGWNHCSGYNYNDKQLIGFAQNHLNGTGIGDLGDILLLPFSGEKAEYKTTFDKKTEKASAGIYSVDLADGVKVKLTATAHTAFHKYKFTKNEVAHLLIDLQSGIVGNETALQDHVATAEINIEDDKQTFTGHQQVNHWVARDFYYIIKLSKPYTKINQLAPKLGEKAKRLVLDFDLKQNESLQVKIGISTVSISGAKQNLEAENAYWDFDKIVKQAKSDWNSILSRVEIEGTKDQKTNFYTALYHLCLQPNNIADVNGEYRGADNKVHHSATKTYYSTFSLWDTYRAAHPLYTILTPERVDGMVNSLIDHYKTEGILPIWTLWGKENFCMIGNHAIPVIADAYLKGFRGFNVDEAYQAVKKSSLKNHQKSNWDIYNKFGYYPFDLVKEESVSRTLESAYDDYAVAEMAKTLGTKEDEFYFNKRAGFYKNIFDSTTNFMRGKDSFGHWRTPFDPFSLSHAGSSGGDYTEGNAWQYTWQVQHDVEGLTKIFGGKITFANKLDSLFKLDSTKKGTGFTGDVSGLIGQYAHGNEPSHHIVYLFTFLDRPWRTQELAREINDRFYLNKPDGLIGNDDCGQMSAWFIFNAMGFYPVNPVGGEYVFGAPQFKKVKLHLPNNKTFTIEAKNYSVKNKYVSEITLNNQLITPHSIHHRDIIEGGKLVFEMTDLPQKPRN
ncbi:glycoside hydrolase family 92 protein [Pedobacter changchengzhani]|uniref:Glycoside hydrolase family 92 protein n=1 Tax=Pedobacter changchengzhani TaxID=2529274 RepID=A0A4R5MKQ0_9SPHI|nr:GH92 family glycosyl hydrolase [Pedobacter changchengzhani]TDG36178.1 glycoside hydrolase family 92 protein [Pedobacter changchengzhani]